MQKRSKDRIRREQRRDHKGRINGVEDGKRRTVKREKVRVKSFVIFTEILLAVETSNRRDVLGTKVALVREFQLGHLLETLLHVGQEFESVVDEIISFLSSFFNSFPSTARSTAKGAQNLVSSLFL